MIVAKNLSKSFNEIKAVNDVSFCIKKGEVVALLGPNGAGKTTLMRLLTGYLVPDGGEISVYGIDIAQQRVDALKKIAYVPLSKGFRHRTAVAGALIHKPRILILDEPTEGLDPNQKFEMRAFIRRYGEKNIVIVSTHIMEEVENIASRILLMNKGKLISDTTPLSLMNLYPRKDMAEVFRFMTAD